MYMLTAEGLSKDTILNVHSKNLKKVKREYTFNTENIFTNKKRIFHIGI